MNQREAVVEAMRANGGFATLGELYKQALKITGVKWETKTPFKSINRIVQNPKYFFRIRPGLWALLEAKDKLPVDLMEKPKPESDHTYYQGLLVELGNLRKQQTFVPKQDRGKSFLGKPLGSFGYARRHLSLYLSRDRAACLGRGRGLVQPTEISVGVYRG
jgi:hypothetical protein